MLVGRIERRHRRGVELLRLFPYKMPMHWLPSDVCVRCQSLVVVVCVRVCSMAVCVSHAGMLVCRP